ncbi:glycosyltransferase family 10 [bacterium]|nr:glycosyltransferase family 10 [bacterium]
MQKVGHELPVAAGKCVGHHPELHQRAPGGWEQNRYWLKDYRFMLAIENRKVQGYVDEKIVNAFFAGGIPVYYGTHEVFSMFNRDAFVYFDIDHPEPALQRILYLDTNRTAYEEVLSKPILATGAMEKFFSLSKGNGFVKDKIRRMVLGRRPHNLA